MTYGNIYLHLYNKFLEKTKFLHLFTFKMPIIDKNLRKNNICYIIFIFIF
jgi:hypothetical protein